MMRKHSAIAVACATLTLAAGFAVHGRWYAALAIALMGLLWLVFAWRGVVWVSAAGLTLLTMAAAMGVLWSLPSLWLLSGTVVGLVAWDLARFTRALQDARDVRNETELVQAHLWRLGIVAGVGWFLGWAALRVQLRFDFIWALALGLMVILGLGGAMRHLQRKSDG
jgi:hypothetical protein